MFVRVLQSELPIYLRLALLPGKLAIPEFKTNGLGSQLRDVGKLNFAGVRI